MCYLSISLHGCRVYPEATWLSPGARGVNSAVLSPAGQGRGTAPGGPPELPGPCPSAVGPRWGSWWLLCASREQLRSNQTLSDITFVEKTHQKWHEFGHSQPILVPYQPRDLKLDQNLHTCDSSIPGKLISIIESTNKAKCGGCNQE